MKDIDVNKTKYSIQPNKNGGENIQHNLQENTNAKRLGTLVRIRNNTVANATATDLAAELSVSRTWPCGGCP